MRFEYLALRDIKVNDVVGYRTGDGMTANAVDNLRDHGHTLELGLDIAAARPDVVPRPADNAPVAQWREYAIAQGMDPQEAADTPRTKLIDTYPDPDVDGAVATDAAAGPPAKSAPKPEWVDWYMSTHPDADRAKVEAMTVRALQGGDPTEPEDS